MILFPLRGRESFLVRVSNRRTGCVSEGEFRTHWAGQFARTFALKRTGRWGGSLEKGGGFERKKKCQRLKGKKKRG